jgi:hypothetical protein
LSLSAVAAVGGLVIGAADDDLRVIQRQVSAMRAASTVTVASDNSRVANIGKSCRAISTAGLSSVALPCRAAGG